MLQASAAAQGQEHGHGRNFGVAGANDFQAVVKRFLVQSGHFHHGVAAGFGLLAAVEGVGGFAVFQAGVLVFRHFVAGLVHREVVGLGGSTAGFGHHAQDNGLLALQILVVHALHVGFGEGLEALLLHGEVVGVAEESLVGGQLAHLAAHAG